MPRESGEGPAGFRDQDSERVRDKDYIIIESFLNTIGWTITLNTTCKFRLIPSFLPQQQRGERGETPSNESCKLLAV